MWKIRGIELPNPGQMIYVDELILRNLRHDGMNKTSKEQVVNFNDPTLLKAYDTYARAFNNAVDLIEESELLFEHYKYARAFALAYTAFEEIGKSQFCADIYTGYLPKELYYKYLTNHRFKGAYTKRVVALDTSFIQLDDKGSNILFNLRNKALYASDSNKIVDEEYKKDAQTLIGYCQNWIETILGVERISERIGTKGFLK